jgi:cytoskeletal protein RodZ
MTSTRPVPSRPPDERPRIQLTLTQVLASALAAITATVAASFLGVAGTVIGAAVASVCTVVGNAIYSLSLQRTSARVRSAVPGAARYVRPVPSPGAGPRRERRRGPRRRWVALAVASVGVFATVLVAVTAVELATGRPLSDLLRGRDGSGTTFIGPVGRTTHHPSGTPTPKPTVSVTPSVVTTPTVTPTVTVTRSPVTRTATPTPTVPSSSAAPTPTPSSSPAPSVGETATTSAATPTG